MFVQGSDAMKTAPIQVDPRDSRERDFPTRVPWSMSGRAWDAYAAAGHGNQSHERLVERGGFGVAEFVACILGRGYSSRAIQAVSVEDIAAVRAMVEAEMEAHV